MLIKHKIDRLEPTSKTYLFIELHIEDFRCKNRIANRVLSLAKANDGYKRANVIRLLRANVSATDLATFVYLDKVSSRYKMCLLRNKFNYAFRNSNNFRGNKVFKKI